MCTNAAGLHLRQVTDNHYYANVRNLLSVTSIYDITNKIQVPLSDLQQGSTMLPVDFNTYPKQDEHYAQRWSYGLYNSLQQSVAIFCDCTQTAPPKNPQKWRYYLVAEAKQDHSLDKNLCYPSPTVAQQ